MSDDSKPADGVGGPGTSGRSGSGESGGGAYPNPHRGKEGKPGEEFTGGQSDKRYYGPGQLDGETADPAAKGRIGQGG